METHTAKHFALQLGSLASLYLSVAFFLVLVFGLINILIPDSAESVWRMENNADMIRLGFAMTIVFFPTYLFLTRTVNKNRRQSADGTYLGLTKWLIYLSLLVGGAVLLGDLVAIIMGFLEGELTTRFILKAVAVLVVAGAAFVYYLKDAQGYWLKNEKQSIAYGSVAAIAIFTTLVVSLAHIQTPQEVRERKIDEQQLQDLRELQWALQDKLRVEKALPETLDTLFSGRPLPEAGEGRSDYVYEVTEDGFKLCAEFAQDSRDQDTFGRAFHGMEEDGPIVTNPEDWYYEAGEWCFSRSVVF